MIFIQQLDTQVEVVDYLELFGISDEKTEEDANSLSAKMCYYTNGSQGMLFYLKESQAIRGMIVSRCFAKY